MMERPGLPTTSGARKAKAPRRRLLGGLLAAGVAAAVAGVLVAATNSSSANPSARAVDKGIWISRAELRELPRKGSAWQRLKAIADRNLGTADLSNQNSNHDVNTLAAALVFARTGQEKYRAKAVSAIMSAIGTEDGGRTLALGRNLVSYVIAADLVNLRDYDPGRNRKFQKWLRDVRRERLSGRTLVSTHEGRPNNWGTHAGASRAAIAVYLGDKKDLARTAKVFRGFLGDRSSYDKFVWGSRSDWQHDPDGPVGINPTGATKEGHSIDGVIPDDMRRGGKFQFPPKRTDYPWGGMSGALVQARILARQGFDAWQWEDRALLRAARFLYELDEEYGRWRADGDDAWMPWLVNAVYGSSFPTEPAVMPGKNMGFTDWTHAR